MNLVLKSLKQKKSKAQASTEVSKKNLSMNFELGLQVEADFMDYGGEDFMIVVCALSELSKVARTKNKNRSELRRSGFFKNGRVFLGHPTES